MKRFKWLFMPALVVMAIFTVDAFNSDAYAQRKEDTTQDSVGVKNNDKEIGSRRGISESLSAPSDNVLDKDGPTKLQMWLGLGSVPVMIIVVKYL